MRAVRFVKRLEWDLPGTVFRHGLTIGDVDNDGDNELVVGTAEGDIYIFKGTEIWQKISGLGLISSVAIGDVFNYGCNALLVICGDGWAHIFYSPRSVNPTKMAPINLLPSPSSLSENSEIHGKMECVHLQRIPTNTKIVLIADVDRDGSNEMIIGLTDRVVRSYRWSTNNELGTGKLVGLNKWECANQIGTVTVQHTSEGLPALLVGQPGGTFMRIKCHFDDDRDEEKEEVEKEEEEGEEEEKLKKRGRTEGKEEKKKEPEVEVEVEEEREEHEQDEEEEEVASCVDYQTLGISRMRNPNISTEIIGDLEPGDIYSSSISSSEDKKKLVTNFIPKYKFRRNFSQPDISRNHNEDETRVRFFSRVNSPEVEDSCLEDLEKIAQSKKLQSARSDKSKPYALATLDGTIMLVKDETILWAMQVDHQIFALCRLDVTGDGADEIIACTWDGHTYILDQQRRSVRFEFEEPVRAFTTGYYSVKPGTSSPCLVYNTFSNKLFLYYDVFLPSMLISPLNPLKDLKPEERKIIEEAIASNPEDVVHAQEKLQSLTEYLLYGIYTEL